MALQQAVSAGSSQADRLETLEFETLQMNEDISGTLDGHVQAFRANEKAVQGQPETAFVDMATA